MGAGALVGVGLGLTGVSTGLGMAAESKQAAQQKRQALIAQAFAERQAADAISLGSTSVARTLSGAESVKGTQRAQIAGAGFDVHVGTALDIPRATDYISGGDAVIIRENARKEAQGYMRQAYSAGEAGKAAGAGAQMAGTLLGGASTIASQWYQYKTRPFQADRNTIR